MRFASLAFLLSLAVAPAAAAQQLIEVPITPYDWALQITGGVQFTGPLPLGGPWSLPSGAGSGTVLASLVDGEVEIEFTATLNGPTNLVLFAGGSGGFSVSNIGDAQTPIVFDLRQMSSTRVQTEKKLVRLDRSSSRYRTQVTV